MAESGGTSFEVVVFLEKVGEYPTFDEAFRAFRPAVLEAVAKAGVREVNEEARLTACYIQKCSDEAALFGIWLFQDAQQKAFQRGLITEDGKLIEQVVEP